MIGRYSRARTFSAVTSLDALLVSYPKSGRTWFRYILSCYFAEVLGQSVMPDLAGMFRFLPNLDWDAERGLPAYSKGPAEGGALPLVAVTHHPPRAEWPPNLPVILMVRDPRDVLVSRYYHATRHKHQFSGDISNFIRDQDKGLPAWVEHTNNWTSVLSGRPHAITRYERLRTCPQTETRRILTFLGQDVDPDRLTRAIAAAEIDRMRQLEVQHGIPGHDYDRSDPQALRIRRGIVGGFQSELSEPDLAWIDSYCRHHLLAASRALLHDCTSAA